MLLLALIGKDLINLISRKIHLELKYKNEKNTLF